MFTPVLPDSSFPVLLLSRSMRFFPGWLVVGGGLILFSLGLLLSFFKTRLLAWWELRGPAPAADADPLFIDDPGALSNPDPLNHK